MISRSDIIGMGETCSLAHPGGGVWEDSAFPPCLKGILSNVKRRTREKLFPPPMCRRGEWFDRPAYGVEEVLAYAEVIREVCKTCQPQHMWNKRPDLPLLLLEVYKQVREGYERRGIK
jgi:hypothetical protein